MKVDYIETEIDGEKISSPYFKGKGPEAPRDDYPTEERHSVVVIIKHPTDDSYLCEDAKGRQCKSFVMGGIEDGETPVEAATRETQEETGYCDLAIDRVDGRAINHFFAEYKNVNRYAYIQFVFGHLRSEKRCEINVHEQAKHEVTWVKRANLPDFLSVEMNKFALDFL